MVRPVCKIALVPGRLDVRWGLVVVVVLATLYGLTLCPTVYWYDSAELAACARSLEVPHPPGYPLYMLVAHAFTWLPGEPALGVNVMSLVFAVLAALACFAIARLVGAQPWAAAVGALTLGVGPAFWGNAVVAEVYAPGLTFTLGALALLLLAVERRRVRLVWLAALVGGLGVGMHMSITTFGLGYLVLVATADDVVDAPRDLLACWRRGWRARARALGGSAVATALGLGVFLYVPLRLPRERGAIDWHGAWQTISGGRFKALFLRDYDVGAQLGLLGRAFADNLTLVGLALALVGLVVLWRRNPRAAVALGLAIAGNAWFFFNYAVADLEVFYLPAMAVTAVLAGVGLDALGEAVVARGAPRALVLALALALPTTLAARSQARCDLSGATQARDYARRLLAEIPEGAEIVLFDPPFEWKRSAVLMYVRRGLGRRSDVVILHRPELAALERRVMRGDVLYVLVPLERIVRRPALRLVEDGVLWRIRRVEAEGEP